MRCFGLLLALMGPCWLGCGDLSKSGGETDPLLMPGDRGVLATKGGDAIPVATSADAYDELVKAAAAEDTHGIVQLMLTGAAFRVPSGTPCLMLDPSVFGGSKVRILSGPYGGAAVFVAWKFVKRTKPASSGGGAETVAEVRGVESPGKGRSDSVAESPSDVAEAAPGDAGDRSTEFREWQDASGRFRLEAAFHSMTAGVVKLQKRDAKVIELPLEKLSEADQAWIRELRRGKPQ